MNGVPGFPHVRGGTFVKGKRQLTGGTDRSYGTYGNTRNAGARQRKLTFDTLYVWFSERHKSFAGRIVHDRRFQCDSETQTRESGASTYYKFGGDRLRKKNRQHL